MAILACAVLVLFEVLLRKFANFSFAGVDEISGYVLAAGSSLAFSITLFRGMHIRIDALYNVLPRWWQSLLDVLSVISLSICSAVLTYYAARLFLFRTEWGSVSNTPLRIPLVVPMTPWLLGLVLFVICSLLLSWHAILNHLRGRYRFGHELADECRRQMLEGQSLARRPRR
jgi:TRAP-type C4-dicarboxylate transport system permease small subunit